jgi:hypothetical protein
MKMRKALCVLGLLLPAYAPAQVVYPYFSPGGALSGTGTSQNVNVGAGAPFITGQLPESNTALAVKPAVTVVATSNQALAGLPTVDGQATAAGSVILATGQSTGAQNGPWVAAAGAWSRPSWYASGSTTQAFQFITAFVRLGTLYQGTTWRLTTANPIIVDTTATTWAETPLALNGTSVTGTLPAAQMPALTGDVTSTIGTVATSIAVNAVTNAQLAQMAANTMKGNNTAGTANAADLTIAQVQALLSIAASANPSASVGLTAVNGTAATYLRSDAAPALSLAIAPNVASPWTASPWVWSNAEPRHLFTESDQGADLKTWDIDVNGGVLAIRTRTDADGAGVNVMTATRGSTTAITNIALGNATNNPTFNWLGNGQMNFVGGMTMTSGGTLTTGKVAVNNSTIPANGIYLPSANTLGFAANTTQVGTWTTTTLTLNGVLNAPNLATSSAATTGTLCWTTGTGLVNVDTTTTCLASSRRYKRDIQPLDVGLPEVMRLRPVSYQLRPQYDPQHLGRQVGLIAEDVAEVDERLISHEPDGRAHGVRYQQLTAVLVKALQDQQRQITQLQTDVRQLRTRRDSHAHDLNRAHSQNRNPGHP